MDKFLTFAGLLLPLLGLALLASCGADARVALGNDAVKLDAVVLYAVDPRTRPRFEPR